MSDTEPSSDAGTEGSTIIEQNSPATVVDFNDLASEITDVEGADFEPTTMPSSKPPERKQLDPRLDPGLQRLEADAGPVVTVNIDVEDGGKATSSKVAANNPSKADAAASTEKLDQLPQLSQAKLEALKKRKHQKNVKDKRRKRRKKEAAKQASQSATTVEAVQDTEAKTAQREKKP